MLYFLYPQDFATFLIFLQLDRVRYANNIPRIQILNIQINSFFTFYGFNI